MRGASVKNKFKLKSKIQKRTREQRTERTETRNKKPREKEERRKERTRKNVYKPYTHRH